MQRKLFVEEMKDKKTVSIYEIDDYVYQTCTLYTAGVLSKQQTLEALKVKKLYNQLVLTTENHYHISIV